MANKIPSYWKMVNLVGNYKENHKLPIAHISRWLRYPKKHCFSKMWIIPNHPQGLKMTKHIWNQYLYMLVVGFRVLRMGNVIIPSRCSIQIINQPTKLFPHCEETLAEKNNSNRDDLNRDNFWRSHLRNCPSISQVPNVEERFNLLMDLLAVEPGHLFPSYCWWMQKSHTTTERMYKTRGK